MSTDSFDVINPKTIFIYYKARCKLLPLGKDHEPKIRWVNEQPKNLYQHADYWNEQKLKQCLPMFENVASVPGIVAGTDSGKNLYLWIFDGDSKAVHDRFAKPIVQLDEKIQILVRTALITELRDSPSDFDTKTTLLDIIKQNTITVKTRKEFGFQFYVLSHKQYDHIDNERKNCEYEVKTDNSLGHAMLPPSTHRKDHNFRYSHLGLRDKIVVSDILYDIVNMALFDITGKSKKQERTKENNSNNTNNNNNRQRRQQQYTYYNLSNDMIEATVSRLVPYYKEHWRNKFVLAFSGVTWNAKITQESVSAILRDLAAITKDAENRVDALTSTYVKAENGDRIVAERRLAQIIAKVRKGELEEGEEEKEENEDLDEDDDELVAAHRIISLLQAFWSEDIKQQLRRERNKAANDPNKIFSVEEAIELVERNKITVIGKVVGISKIQPMLSHASFTCSHCHASSTLTEYFDGSTKPVWKSPVKDRSRCHDCRRGDGIRVINKEHINSLEIQIQDLDKINDAKQLGVILQEQNIKNIHFNDVLILKGDIAVVSKYDNLRSKSESVLFVDSVQRQTKDEDIEITQEDIKSFKEFVANAKNEGKNVFEALAEITAPLTIGNKLAKKGVLIVAANAGIPNDDKRQPNRLRSHGGLVGDPGLGKSRFLLQACQYVPGSEFVNMRSSTPISLTLYVEKDENGQKIVRPGPVVIPGILGLDEFGAMTKIEDNNYFHNVLEEGKFTGWKYGMNVPVDAHPSVIITANPKGGRWKNSKEIDENEFPMLVQFGDRLDFVIPYIEDRSEKHIRNYSAKRRELYEKLKGDDIDKLILWLKKYLIYARGFISTIPTELKILHEDYLVEIAKKGAKGIPRKIEALERISIAISKLKLKTIVDAEDITDAIQFFNEVLQHYNQDASTSAKDLVSSYVIEYLKENKSSKFKLEDVINIVCSKQKVAENYIGSYRTLESNWKIRGIRTALENHPNIIEYDGCPITFAWEDKDNNDSNKTNTTNTGTEDSRKEDKKTKSEESEESEESEATFENRENKFAQGSTTNRDIKTIEEKDRTLKKNYFENQKAASDSSDSNPKSVPNSNNTINTADNTTKFKVKPSPRAHVFNTSLADETEKQQ